MNNILDAEALFIEATYLVPEDVELFKKQIKAQNLMDWEDLMDSLRIVVEKVIDKCAKEAQLTEYAMEFMQEGASEAIDKDSILGVKKLIKYHEND